MLSVIMLSVIMLSVVILDVVAPIFGGVGKCENELAETFKKIYRSLNFCSGSVQSH
jgi:hypothetical protein